MLVLAQSPLFGVLEVPAGGRTVERAPVVEASVVCEHLGRQHVEERVPEVELHLGRRRRDGREEGERRVEACGDVGVEVGDAWRDDDAPQRAPLLRGCDAGERGEQRLAVGDRSRHRSRVVEARRQRDDAVESVQGRASA